MNTTVTLSDRTLDLLDKTVSAGAVALWAFILYWIYTQAMAKVQYAVIFLGGVLALYILNESVESLKEDDALDLVVLLSCAVVVLAASAYFAFEYPEVYTIRQGWAHDHEYVLATLLMVSMLYLTWREFGRLFLALLGGVILYAVYGNFVPESSIFYHGGIPYRHLMQQLVTDLAGFYGSLTQLTAAWIAPFLLYAGLLFGYGAFDHILRVAIQISKYIRSGVAQTAVISSAIIGSINGSYTANAGMTGSFTIPTMKDSGIEAHNAAGIEAVASTSGQVLPPVMGASAFVMASFLGIRYVDVVVAGLIPAAILVACIAVAVHYTSIRDTGEQDLVFEDFFDHELTRAEKVVEGIRFGVPFLVLIYVLGILQWTIMTAALVTVVSMVVLGVLMPLPHAMHKAGVGAIPGELFDQVKNTVAGFRRGALILAPIAIILAAINGVVDLLMVTGVPSGLALMLIELSAGVLLFAALLGMGICIIMGVGMPTVAAYVIVAILIAPTFVQDLGIPELAAHYMVFYAAILAGITPPVATAAVVTSGLAEANFWKTCATSIRIAAPLFVLPISFIYHPEIVSMSLGAPSLFAGLIILLGGITIIYGLNYSFKLRHRVSIPLRLLLFALGAVIMVYPGQTVQLGGVALFGAVFVAEKVMVRGWKFPAVTGAR